MYFKLSIKIFAIFVINITDIDEKIVNKPLKFTDDIKVLGIAGYEEDAAALQKNLDSLVS